MIKRQLFLSSTLSALTKEESNLVKSMLHELSIDATCPTKSSSEECNKNWAVEKYWKYMSMTYETLTKPTLSFS